MRLTDDFPDDHAGPPHLLELLRHLEDADLRFHGPYAWGANDRVLEVIGERNAVARVAASAGSSLDRRARSRLAREGWFAFGKRGNVPDVHVRVISKAGAEAIAMLLAAFRLAELRFAGPGWRYVATRRQEGFRTVFAFVVRPNAVWLVELLANVAERLELGLHYEIEHGQIEARIGDLEITFGCWSELGQRARFERAPGDLP